ncbi:uncharacterized protein J7T54_007944 [Emericellopsis cladophorae]|uniref:Spindle assembly checkpoint component MAD1 n=1 Tax=Emericellopsis cladophorae TaxID=2686198 RepID=A0A9Q0BHK5_9HYPO|nr:uncharacterized protein J7T54_007944 [Emericellopsis cladophorae]KAI6784850.1 hypothetical protein J7T54_007944 [Emericellopsis cladophorae]
MADSGRPESRSSFKENMAPPDADQYEKYRKEIESLKAEIGTLKYRIQTSESEQAIEQSTQAGRLEQATRREQDAIQAREASEREHEKLVEEFRATKRELEDVQESIDVDKKAWERKTREAQDNVRLLQEQVDDLTDAKEEAARIADKKTNDLQAQITSMQTSLQEIEQDSSAKDTALQEAQEELNARDGRISELEADVLRLKAHSGDMETMQIIRKELSEQVEYIRDLESKNRQQLSELKHLRAMAKSVEVVEEEKRSLQRKVEFAQMLEQELSEERMQRQRLEDERLAWTSYLKSETGDVEFKSPESLARAYTEERFTSASHVERIGALQAELSSLQNTVRSLEEDRSTLRNQAEEAKSAATSLTADKGRMRLERQRALAVKEVEYLRAQLKTYDVEDQTLETENFDQARVDRVNELERIVDEYKSEVQNLHNELAMAEASKGAELSPQLSTGSKRPREDGSAMQEQLGQLTRKNRKLQEEIGTMQTQVAVLEKDLSANREQLAAAKEHNATRVLSLRSNPTSDYEGIKRATLYALQKENRELLATLQSRNANKEAGIKYIPKSVLGSMEREVEAAKAETASAQKSARRLKEVWGSKSQEFKEAIFSTLGWTVTFIPNGKMRVESTFFPSQSDEHENSIVFDGERGTMKVGGGPKSAFARRISDQIGFWVREKGCIPGFLAALTLEFYEEHAKKSQD